MQVSRDYRITIPYRIRKQLGMLPGTEVDIVMIDGSVYIVKKGTKIDLPQNGTKKNANPTKR
ncbi:MAG TPA: AbrB/MazE/SpoVT family DNA-binding domain-containing protein [Pyrinomonadaceae bacterium]